MDNQLIPKIRFKNNNNNWRIRTLNDLTTIFDGIHQTPNYKKNGIPFISVENLNTLDADKFISKEDFYKYFKNNKSKVNDILMSRIGSIGKTNIITQQSPISYYVSLSLIRPNTKALIPKYLLFNIQSPIFQRKLWQRTLHVAFPKKINKNEIAKINFSLPSISEQQKIGQFFSKLDLLIDLQSQKLSHLKQLKKGYLQKIFPQKGESVPRLRFDRFMDKWNESKLNDLVKESNLKESINPSENNLLSVKLHFKGIHPTKEHPRITKKRRKYYYRNSGELIIGKQNFQNGGFGIAKNNVNGLIASSAILSFDFLNNVNNEFLLNSMMRNNWLQMTTIYLNGTGQKEYGTDTLKNLQISVPNIQEQQKIGQFFKCLNQLIEMQNSKLNKLEKLKQGYLQKMFI